VNDPTQILIVDSEEGARALAVDVLRRAGYSTLEAKSGEEAVEIAQRDQPCIVVLEVDLEGLCGYEVCRELREMFGEGVAILFLSGVRTESFDRVAGLLLGADDYLTKPFSPDELRARVHGLIRRSQTFTSNGASSLTQRERDVLQLLVQGLDTKEIATRLFISPRTVGAHTEHIFTKLGVHSRSRAVALAYRDKLVERSWFRTLEAIPALLPANDFLCEWLSACSTALAG
jgi:DNA-binding NarL/FixJ family response regulator